jgi:DNA-binding SARP family transcriptional activator
MSVIHLDVDADAINVGILGPTVVGWGDRDVALSSTGAVLILILAVMPGNTAMSGDIQRKAWSDREPDNKTASRLRSAILDLRSRFASAVGETRPRASCPPYRTVIAGTPGYQLPAVRTDADVFADLAGQARLSLQREDPWTAWRRACDALRLWRGIPLADASGRPFAIESAVRLEQARLTAETTRCEAALMLGMHREIIPDLELLAAVWPGDFGITCLLVTALARCGRVGQAAGVCYKALSDAQEHGVDDTAHGQLQYDLLNGKISFAGPPWQAARLHRLRQLSSRFNGPGMGVAEMLGPRRGVGPQLAPCLVTVALPRKGRTQQRACPQSCVVQRPIELFCRRDRFPRADLRLRCSPESELRRTQDEPVRGNINSPDWPEVPHDLFRFGIALLGIETASQRPAESYHDRRRQIRDRGCLSDRHSGN